MTLPTGTISLAMVNMELGKTSTTNIKLGNSDVRALAGRSSGSISMSHLQGKSAETLSLSLPASLYDAGMNSSALTVTIRNDGTWAAGLDVGDWLEGGDPSDYQVKFDATGSSSYWSSLVNSGSWYTLSSSQAVVFSRNIGGISVSTLTVTIRKISDTSKSVSDTVQMQVEVTGGDFNPM